MLNLLSCFSSSKMYKLFWFMSYLLDFSIQLTFLRQSSIYFAFYVLYKDQSSYFSLLRFSFSSCRVFSDCFDFSSFASLSWRSALRSLNVLRSSLSFLISSYCSSVLNFMETFMVSSCWDILLSNVVFLDSWSSEDFFFFLRSWVVRMIRRLQDYSSSLRASSF